MRRSVIEIGPAVECDTAFDFVADPVHETEWNPSAIRVDRLSAGPVAVGSAFTVVGRMVGREMTVQVEVVELDPPHRTRTRATGGPMIFHTTYVVEGSGSGSVVRMTVDVVPGGVLRPLSPLIQIGFHRRLKRLAPRLQAAIETHAKA